MLDRAPDAELVRRAVVELGGVAFTNFCIYRRQSPTKQAAYRGEAEPSNAGRGVELVDVTTAFSSRIPWLASNRALLADDLDADETKLIEDLLDSLEVKHSGVEPAKWQLRRPVSFEQQVASFMVPCRRGVAAALFCSPLPTLRSVRIEAVPERDGRYQLEVYASRRAEPGVIMPADASAISTYLGAHLGVEFEGRRWTVEHIASERKDSRVGVIPDRGKIRYSVNWGSRRG